MYCIRYSRLCSSITKLKYSLSTGGKVVRRYESNQSAVPEQQPVTAPHIPVMKDSVLKHLYLEPNSVFIDMTFGFGGHTRSILENYENIKVYCLDRDPVAYKYAQELQKLYPTQVIPLLGKFSELPQLLKEHGVAKNSIDGILFDFGCSSMQFDDAKRGFSVSKDGPLDMRMDGDRFPDSPTAADVLNTADEIDLYKIFKIYGEEKKARKIARAVVEARYTFTTLQTTSDLGDFLTNLMGNEVRLDKLNRRTHAGTKIFQALRIFVNNELNELNYGMVLAHRYLKIGGTLITLTFHSLEDLIVKRHVSGNISDNTINVLPLKYVNFNAYDDEQIVENLTSMFWQSLTKHVVTPSQFEIDENPRCRSAKMRAVVKIK